MYGGRRTARRARPTAALLTLAAHVLFLVLLLIDKRPPRPAPTKREMVLIPITLQPLPEELEQDLAGEGREPDTTAPSPPRAAPLPRPATAITIEPPASPPQENATPELDGDTLAETARLAARRFEELDGPAPTFSAAPATMRQPCEPRKQSFKFKEDRKSTGGSASLTLGWEKQDPDKHLFDDMKAGKTQRSSVPDPVTCE